ncbi:hypothetical protein BU26DRAFT_59710 [Trematosphaeria pertusa]|uniref:Uncharacterized protein n=1 Tax=Trematosphaeria pertusa TaxID=390896 RepID=A0A6A6I8Y7_9PLEO|nr:uncharacterized protein BU26DRAFT_59710 [Trematosphaeria pertusa]KAF2245983.1 hypothetical protein BU26DRAFT_59710 [Trematosphaeria pertusa]
MSTAIGPWPFCRPGSPELISESARRDLQFRFASASSSWRILAGVLRVSKRLLAYTAIGATASFTDVSLQTGNDWGSAWVHARVSAKRLTPLLGATPEIAGVANVLDTRYDVRSERGVFGEVWRMEAYRAHN